MVYVFFFFDLFVFFFFPNKRSYIVVQDKAITCDCKYLIKSANICLKKKKKNKAI